MIKLWSVLAFLAVVVPMCLSVAVCARAYRASAAGSRGGKWLTVLVALFVAIVAPMFLLNPHEDVYTGLDVAMYRHMAHGFSGGRGFHDVDYKFREIPESLRPYFLSRWIVGAPNKPSRDMVFEITKMPEMETAPMFLPTLPLAANGCGLLGMSPDRFVPLVAVLWIACLVFAAARAGGFWGLAAVFALVFGTSWPSWFLRGFHPEVVGGALISTVVAASATGRHTWRLHALFGFMLGFAISYHPTMSVLALPVALALMVNDGRWSSTSSLLAFGAIGAMPLLLITKYVCAPYGNFLDPEHLVEMLRVVAQIRSLGYALLGAVVLGFAAMAFTHSGKLKGRVVSPAMWRTCAIGCGVVSVLALLVPSIAGGNLERGWDTAFGELRLFLLTAVFSWVAVFAARRPLHERVLVAIFCVSSLVFIYIEGVEPTAGVWSQRRFAPLMLCFAGACAGPLAEWLKGLAVRSRLLAVGLAGVMTITCALAVAVNDPAYFATSNKDAEALVAWTRSAVESGGGDNALAVFDYFPRSVPHQIDLDENVLGLCEYTTRNFAHGPAMVWLEKEAARRPLLFVSAYAEVDSLLEQGLWLQPVCSTSASFGLMPGSAFSQNPGVKRAQMITVYNAVPVAASNLTTAVQRQNFDGGPLGLRQPWRRAPRGGYWTLEGSGIVGPVPPPGGEVYIKVQGKWYPPPGVEWPVQEITITPPFGGEPLRMEIPAGEDATEVAGVIRRMPDDMPDGNYTGVYRINATTPYNPEEYGIRGFGAGLGVVLDYAEIGIAAP